MKKTVNQTLMIMWFPWRKCFSEANVNVIYVVQRSEYDPTSFVFKCDYFPSINFGGMREQSKSKELDWVFQEAASAVGGSGK